MKGAKKKIAWIAIIGMLAIAIGVIAKKYIIYSSRHPSVALLMIDTLRADKLGVYGSGSPASQELDQIAERAVIFEKAISQASWTRSSIASLLTGRYPRAAGIVKEKWDRLPEEADTLAEVLSRNGYQTIGLTANPQLNNDFHFNQGFSQYIESSVIFSWMKKQTGKVRASRERVVSSADEMIESAMRLVSDRGSSAPLYLQMLFMDVHAHHRISDDQVDTDLRSFPDSAYLQSVRNATKPLASFIKELDHLLSGNVIFIVTSDHGEGLDDHPNVDGSRGHGNLLYRSQVHVPLIVIEGSSLQTHTAQRIEPVVELVDLLPTVLGLVGIEDNHPRDGNSLVPLIEGKENVVSKVAFSETQWRPAVRKMAVTDGDWFYIENLDKWQGVDAEELQAFSLAQDGGGTNQIASAPREAAQLRGALRAKIRAQMAP